MVNSQKKLLSITLAFCSVYILLGQKPIFTATVNLDSVLLGNYIEVTFQVENVANAKIETPNFEGFNLVGGPNFSSSMQVINGDVTQKVSQSYWLEPQDVGQYFIPPAQVKNGEEWLQTEAIEINVYHNPDGIVQEAPKRKKEREDFGFQWPERQAPKLPQDKPKKRRKTYRM
jgi:BatD DUF11 like domain